MAISWRWRILSLATAAAAMLCFAVPGRAQEAACPVAAPPNPAFVDYLRGIAVGRQATCSEDGYPLGAIPSPVDLSHTRGMSVLNIPPVFRGLSSRNTLESSDSLPSFYDLRLQSPAKLPPVRDQGSCGSCWAFASYGSLEGCLLPSQSYDFSENHLKNTHGYDWTCCEGGTHQMATAYLARWGGPVMESSDPYSTGCTSPTGLSPILHVQSVNFIPDRGGSFDNTNIKQAVMYYGPVYTEMYWTGGCYNAGTYSYCCTTAQPINHAVCIVGWDDDFPAANFTSSPPGNGAFICRNSWGSGWGEAGYFYCSYYDARIGSGVAVFSNAEPVTNYDRVYQYDPLGWVASTGYENQTAWFANIFTADAACELNAVSFYSGSPSSSYEVSIYVNPTTGPINSSGPVCTQTGTLPYHGYHTIPLNSPMEVSAGQRFSVVVKLTTPGYNTPIAYEYPMSQYSTQADSNPGESYISINGVSWSDIYNVYNRANVCLKAFVNDYELTVSPSTGLDSEGPQGGEFAPSSANYTLTNVGSSPIDWTATPTAAWLTASPGGGTLNASDTTTVTVSINANATNLPAGYYTAAVQFHPLGGAHGDTTRQVNLSVVSPYDVRPSPFGWLEPTSPTVLFLGDNSVSAAQSIPFEFSLYEKPYTQLYVAANGMIGFAGIGMTSGSNVDLPNAALPNALICPYWDDLNPGAGGTVKIGTCGESPDRKLVVSWLDVPIKANPASTLTFQVVLCEGSKDILFQYLDVADTDLTYGAGRKATVGVENYNGTLGTRYSYNGSVLLKPKSALRFTDRGPELMSIKKQADGYPTPLSRQIVTAAFPDEFYIESDDRAGGIAVHRFGHEIECGARASVNGVLGTSSDGERFIEASYVGQDGVGSVHPLLMTAPALGGGDWGWGPADPGGQQGVELGIGLNTIGLLVRLCGKVQNVRSDYFYLDDHNTQLANAMAKVECPAGVGIPPVGTFVGVTGISCLEYSGGVYRRTLRVRAASDITVYASP